MTQTYEIPEIIRLAGEGIWELDVMLSVHAIIHEHNARGPE